ncbi:homoserine kinase [Ktedonobacteria bacterium brp13]|nr:homoserine kinase [Ktedonobacteria bacterium brp13]
MPWAASNSIPQEALQAIINDFALGQFEQATWAGGYSNQNYFVTTTTGDFLVKFLLNERVEINKEFVYLERLQQHHYPAAYYLKAPNGSYLWEGHERRAVLEKRLAGQPPTRQDNVCWLIGAQLARLHALPYAGLPATRNVLSREYLTHGMALAQQSFDRELLVPLIDAYEQIAQLPYEQLPYGIQHGDPTRNNCLFAQETFVALLDWEEVGTGPVLIDMAVAILSCCYRYQGAGNAVREERWYRSFLSGYTSQRPLTALEEKYLPLASRYAALVFSLWGLLQFGLYYPDQKLLQGWLHPAIQVL